MKLVEMADREGENFNTAIGLGLQAILVLAAFSVSRGTRSRAERTDDDSHAERLRAGHAAELLPLEQHAGRRAVRRWPRPARCARDDNLEQQVRRMLADEKSDALVENFAGQWLQLRNLKIAAPDKRSIRTSTSSSAGDAARDGAVLRRDHARRPQRARVLDADFTFVNERLARHYGIPDVKGEEFRKVALDPAQRGGVLTQASVLTVTSNPTRTSPVKRGKWVLENLFGTPPAAAAARCAGARGSRRGGTRRLAARADGAAPRECRTVRSATIAWIRSASAWKTTTASAAGATRTAVRDRRLG